MLIAADMTEEKLLTVRKKMTGLKLIALKKLEALPSKVHLSSEEVSHLFIQLDFGANVYDIAFNAGISIKKISMMYGKYCDDADNNPPRPMSQNIDKYRTINCLDRVDEFLLLGLTGETGAKYWGDISKDMVADIMHNHPITGWYYYKLKDLFDRGKKNTGFRNLSKRRSQPDEITRQEMEWVAEELAIAEGTKPRKYRSPVHKDGSGNDMPKSIFQIRREIVTEEVTIPV